MKPPKIDVWIQWSMGKVVAQMSDGASVTAEHLSELKGRVRGNAVILVGRGAAFVKSVRLPNIRNADYRAMVALQAPQVFPASDTLSLGYQLSENISPEGRLATVAAIPTATLEEIYASAQQAGLQVLGAIPASVGSAHIAKSKGHLEAVVVESTDDGFGIDVVQNGVTAYSRVAPATADLNSEVARTLAAGGYSERPIIMAGGAEPGLRAADAIRTQMVCEPLIELPSAVEAKERAAVATRSRLAALMAMAALLAAALVYDGRDTAAKEAQKQRVAFTNGLRQSLKRKTAAEKVETQVKELLATYNRAYGPSQKPSDAIIAAGNLLPKNVWLTGVNFERGKDLQLRGIAMNNEAIQLYLESLSAQSRFRDVKLVFANNSTIETTNVVQFSITTHIVGNLPTLKTKQEIKAESKSKRTVKK